MCYIFIFIFYHNRTSKVINKHSSQSKNALIFIFQIIQLTFFCLNKYKNVLCLDLSYNLHHYIFFTLKQTINVTCIPYYFCYSTCNLMLMFIKYRFILKTIKYFKGYYYLNRALLNFFSLKNKRNFGFKQGNYSPV